jgi:hypothetical protein
MNPLEIVRTDATTARRELQDRVRTGLLIRLAPGRYVDGDSWRRATARDRHLARIEAVHDRIAPHLVLSHLSAAAMHGLACPVEFPDRVHVIDPRRAKAQTTRSLRKHAGAQRTLTTEVSTMGRPITDLCSTGVDVALDEELRLAVPVLDQVRDRGISVQSLLHELERRGRVQNVGRAAGAIELADVGSGSPGESVGRVALAEIGAPRPVLQHEFTDHSGFIARVDYWYPEYGVVLEFDGAVKYRDARFRRAGMSAADVVVEEKRREDRLRRVPAVNGVGRFGWPEVNDRGLLADVVRSAGLPLRPGAGAPPVGGRHHVR